MRALFAFLAGSLFGAGLLVSGMTDTTKVPFVMGGAIIPMAIAWRYAVGRRPVLGGEFPAPPAPKIGHNLVIGSILFGVGWGLVGLCPGPALASITYGGVGGLVFLGAMIAGMLAAPPVRTRIDAIAGSA